MLRMKAISLFCQNTLFVVYFLSSVATSILFVTRMVPIWLTKHLVRLKECETQTLKKKTGRQLGAHISEGIPSQSHLFFFSTLQLHWDLVQEDVACSAVCWKNNDPDLIAKIFFGF